MGSQLGNASVDLSVDLEGFLAKIKQAVAEGVKILGDFEKNNKLKISVEIPKLTSDLKTAANETTKLSDSAKNVVNSFQAINKINFSGFAVGVQNISKEAANASQQIKSTGPAAQVGLGNVSQQSEKAASGLNRVSVAGGDALNKLLRFEILKSVMDAVGAAIRGVEGLFDKLTDSAVKMDSALLGLQGVAKFKGIDPASITETVKGLDLVKGGLLNIADASLAMKNLLMTNFTLEQSVELLKRFGDTAAFGRQQNLGFGYAISSTTEGLKNQMEQEVDNAGMTKNLTTILQEQGKSKSDLSLISSDLSVRTALYNGILKETTAQLGDAAIYSGTFAGLTQKVGSQITYLAADLGRLLYPILTDINNIVLQAIDFFKTLPDSIKLSVVAIGAFGIAVAGLIPLLAILNIEFAGAPIIIGAIITSLAGLVIAFAKNFEAIKEFVVELVGGEEGLKAFKTEADYTLTQLKSFAGFMKDTMWKAVDEIKKIIYETVESFKKASGGSEQLRVDVRKLIDDALTGLYKILTSLITAFVTIIDAFSKTIIKTNELYDSTGRTKTGLQSLDESLVTITGTLSRVISLAGSAVSSFIALAKIGYDFDQIFKGFLNANVYDVVFNGYFGVMSNKLKTLMDDATNVREILTGSFKNFEQGLTINSRNPNDFTDAENLGVSNTIRPPKTSFDGKPQDIAAPSTDKGGKGKKEKDPEQEEEKQLNKILQLEKDKLAIAKDDYSTKKITGEELQKEFDTAKNILEDAKSKLIYESNIVKVTKEIKDIEKDVADFNKKTNEELQKRLESLQKIDDFLQSRKDANLEGQKKDFAGLDKTYSTQTETINKDEHLTDADKEFQIKRLNAERERELYQMTAKFKQENEVNINRQQLELEGNRYKLAIFNINDEYRQKEQQIIKTVADETAKQKLLHLNKMKWNQELGKVRTDDELFFFGLIQNKWADLSTGVTGLMNGAFDEIGQHVHGVFEELFIEIEKMLFQYVINNLFQSVLGSLLSLIPGGGLFGGILGKIIPMAGNAGNGIASAVKFAGGAIPGRAMGGSVNANTTYIVGEEGPELFVPGVGGAIINHPQTQALINRSQEFAAGFRERFPLTFNQTITGSYEDRVSAMADKLRIENKEKPVQNIDVHFDNWQLALTREMKSEADWIKHVDEDLLPRIAGGLRRAGSKYFTSDLAN